MSPCVPLAAPGFGVEELVQILFVVLVIVVPLILRLIGAAARNQPPVVRPRPVRPPPDENVLDEVGEFLRRATQRRPGPPAGPAAPLAPRPAERPVTAQVVRERPVEAQTAARPSLTASRGQEVVQSEQQLGQRLEQTFRREASELAATFPTPPAATPPPGEQRAALPTATAAGLAALFATPENIRQAIVVSEILQRPEHRWS